MTRKAGHYSTTMSRLQLKAVGQSACGKDSVPISWYLIMVTCKECLRIIQEEDKMAISAASQNGKGMKE